MPAATQVLQYHKPITQVRYTAPIIGAAGANATIEWHSNAVFTARQQRTHVTQ
jgi:hypothetical protein